MGFLSSVVTFLSLGAWVQANKTIQEEAREPEGMTAYEGGQVGGRRGLAEESRRKKVGSVEIRREQRRRTEGKRVTQDAKKRAPWRKEIERQADRQADLTVPTTQATRGKGKKYVGSIGNNSPDNLII